MSEIELVGLSAALKEDLMDDLTVDSMAMKLAGQLAESLVGEMVD